MDFLSKKYLFTPGPVPVPPKALLTMAQPMTHHRLPEFSEILKEIRENLKYLFQTKNNVYFFASSGTGAMEAAILNLFSPGDKVVVVSAGKFGQRWFELAKTYGLNPIVIELPWGKAVRPEQVEEVLNSHPNVKGVLLQACETSTGVKHPVREIAQLTKDRETVIVVDAITGLGVFDLPMDEWGLDVVITGSQKALSLPPGLSFIAFSDKAISFSERSTLPKYYFSLQKEKKAYEKDTTSFTPAVSLLLGLQVVLQRIKEIGLKELFTHYHVQATACREAVKALGLKIFPEVPSESLTVIEVPEGVKTGDLINFLKNKLGIIFAGGQDHLKGKIIRITHMGDQSLFDLLIAISALEVGLNLFGYQVELGVGVKASEQVIFEHLRQKYFQA
ncbi:alanine--glyoxylate aminotransferase family protein [Thermodesulfobacterium sp. TA1]|uniref:pyridoxal-phosphate-dependent aminotransferase family protein n=1 Tax=Thermodesulfobacterium sp. TA1 TaxID=2234087 RepID=UPI00123278CD|nr:alanine--glyoxylate aminotransferase family protein [Thermodesulfobacterium sp. TA1]QER41552.1 alanine--glyoxylate aminotransferase family protein [Thermodesulfobacterium sp. TA1]